MKTKGLVFGHAIGDALGVPVEFEPRAALSADPVREMRGFGAHPVPAGAWSDDTSMTLCLLDSLAECGCIDHKDIMERFVRWYEKAEYTPTGAMFDIGIATRQALTRYMRGTAPLLCGGRGDHDNGNGSLMRIAPLALYLHKKRGKNLSAEDMRDVHEVSMLTHAHVRSQMACGIYVLIAVRLLEGNNIKDAIRDGLGAAYGFYRDRAEFADELVTYARLWKVAEFAALPENRIKSGGYVVDTLEAVLWCLMNTESYKSCVLKAVNLGEDTDTVGAIAGGLAGLAYGWDSISPEWVRGLLRADYIGELCDKFVAALK